MKKFVYNLANTGTFFMFCFQAGMAAVSAFVETITLDNAKDV